VARRVVFNLYGNNQIDSDGDGLPGRGRDAELLRRHRAGSERAVAGRHLRFAATRT
jgi:hypothetical protein